MKGDNSKILAISLALLAVIAVIISIFFNSPREEKNKQYILDNPSEFFTVNSCLYRTISYASNKDSDSLLKVLDSKYKNQEKIDSTNVLSKFPDIPENATFTSKKMYYEIEGNGVTKYYVYGVVEENILHDYDEVEIDRGTDIYFIVRLDSNNQIFTVQPYDGEIFMDGEVNEK